MRIAAFGEHGKLTIVDKFGVWLSHRRVRQFLPALQGLVVGDFGCGFHASLTRPLLADVAHAWLADVHVDSQLARHANVTVVEGLLPQSLLAIPDATLDAVFCVSVLEHLDAPAELLRQIHRVLKPGGTALLNVPSWRGKTFLEFSAFVLHTSPAVEMDDHKTYYDVKDLWPMLVAAGWRPSRIRCWPHKLGLNTFAVCRKDAP